MKFFLTKRKFLLALKSLKWLREKSVNTYDYLDALFRFNNYIKENSAKIHEEHLKLAESKINLNEIDQAKVRVLTEEKNIVALTEIKLRIEKLFINSISNTTLTNALKELFDAPKNVLRNINHTYTSSLGIYITMNFGVNEYEEYKVRTFYFTYLEKFKR